MTDVPRENQSDDARFADSDELAGADLLHDSDSGLLIGIEETSQREIRYKGPSHLLTIAPNRTGKGVGVVIPNLLSNPGYPGSIVVTDIKGELAAVTARYRREILGHKVYVINPWRDKMQQDLGVDLGDSPFNPLASLKADSPSLLADALMFAKMLVPIPAWDNGNGKYFKGEAQSLLKLFMCWLALNPDENADEYVGVTLPNLRESLLGRFDSVLEELIENGEPSPDPLRRTLQVDAVYFRNMKNTAEKQFMGAYGEAKAALDIYDGAGALGKHLSGHSGLDFRKIKQEPSTIYIVVPSERLTDYRGWFDLVVGSAVKAVTSAPTGGKVLFLLDEFGNMGYLPYIRDEVSGSPGKGLQFWFIMQEWAQFVNTYGKGASTFWNQADIKQVFAIQEEAVIQLIQPRLGTYTGQMAAQHEHFIKSPKIAHKPDGVISINSSDETINLNSRSEKDVHLIKPHNLYQLPRDEQLIFHAHLSPIKAKKLNYLESEKYNIRAAPNPWHLKKSTQALEKEYAKLTNS